MNSSRFISKHHDAFTLIEFIVIMSIFAVMVGVVMFNFNGFRSAVTLDNLAHDIGVSIRQIQTNSGASLSTVDDPENEIPRGIAFYPDPENSGQFASEFKLFKDSYNGDGLLTDGDTVLDTIEIQTQDRITDISYIDQSNQSYPISVQNIGITFKRYKTDALFTTDDGFLSDASAVVITVGSPADNTGRSERVRTVTISKIGQVSIK